MDNLKLLLFTLTPPRSLVVLLVNQSTATQINFYLIWEANTVYFRVSCLLSFPFNLDKIAVTGCPRTQDFPGVLRGTLVGGETQTLSATVCLWLDVAQCWLILTSLWVRQCRFVFPIVLKLIFNLEAWIHCDDDGSDDAIQWPKSLWVFALANKNEKASCYSFPKPGSNRSNSRTCVF